MLAAQAVSRPAWTIGGLVARDGSATLDLDSPAGGLAVRVSSDVDHLLGLDLRLPSQAAVPPSDHWLRGDDVVAVYRPVDPRRLEATAMWRRLSPDHRAWELTVSAQTTLVESDGALAVISEIASGHVLIGGADGDRVKWSPLEPLTSCPIGATQILVRRARDAVLVAVHPTDSKRIVLTHEGCRTRISCWLFSAAIEKGVLHRGRVLAAIGRQDETTWANDLIARLAASPPPLAS